AALFRSHRRVAMALTIPLLVLAAGTRSAPSDAASRTSTRWPIKHVVIIVKENRSFDHLFGLFPGADGTTTADDAGTTIPLTRGVMRMPGKLPHHYADALADWNGGVSDGFHRGRESRSVPFLAMSP